jgi:hypothetical protein
MNSPRWNLGKAYQKYLNPEGVEYKKNPRFLLIVTFISSLSIPSPMPEFVVSGMRYDFPKLKSRAKFFEAKKFCATVNWVWGKPRSASTETTL